MIKLNEQCEVLTKEGWKKPSELTMNDKLIFLNDDFNKCITKVMTLGLTIPTGDDFYTANVFVSGDFSKQNRIIVDKTAHILIGLEKNPMMKPYYARVKSLITGRPDLWPLYKLKVGETPESEQQGVAYFSMYIDFSAIGNKEKKDKPITVIETVSGRLIIRSSDNTVFVQLSDVKIKL